MHRCSQPARLVGDVTHVKDEGTSSGHVAQPVPLPLSLVSLLGTRQGLGAARFVRGDRIRHGCRRQCLVHTPRDTDGDTAVPLGAGCTSPVWHLTTGSRVSVTHSDQGLSFYRRPRLTRPTCLLTAAPCGDGEQSNAGEDTSPLPRTPAIGQPAPPKETLLLSLKLDLCLIQSWLWIPNSWCIG